MIFSLLEQVKTLLENELKDPAAYMSQGEQNEVVKTPKVFAGGLPVSDESIYPYVLLELPRGTDELEYASIELEIVCGVFARDFVEGTRALSNIIDRCRRALLASPASGAWRLDRPLTWFMGDQTELAQPRPFHLGKLVTTWRSAPIKEVQNVI